MGRPKATLPWGEDDTFVSSELRAMGEAGLTPLVLVCGVHAEETRAAIPHDLGVTVVQNPEPERGQLSSLKIALRSLDAETDLTGALVALVDHPAIRASTLSALIEAVAENEIVIPLWNGKRGHPVIFGRGLWPEIFRAPDEAGARPVVRRDPRRVRQIDVDDPGVLVDIDTPDDLRAARNRD